MINTRPVTRCVVLAGMAFACLVGPWTMAGESSFATTVESTQPKLVKIYGAGGLRGLEAYQSGLLISSDGLVLTVWSYVLDSDVVTVTLNDGRKFAAELVGADPRLEIALLRIKATELECFNLDAAVEIGSGDRVLAFSNLYGVATGNEPSSVLHGVVSAKSKLAARRGGFQTPYQGDVYVLDAMTNNPGAAGGALTDRQGRLAGLLGKELRNSLNNTWLNYAIPIGELVVAVEDIKAGKSRPRNVEDVVKRPVEAHNPATLGMRLVPDVLAKTPPFVDRVERGSAADKAGLRPDDLVLFANGRLVSSCKALLDELSLIDRGENVTLMVERDSTLLEITISASP